MSGAALAVDGMRVILAQHFWPRLVGLLGRRGLAADEALFLSPCNNVHTFFMRFAIDVVFVDQHGVVLSVVPALGPWRIAAAWRAHACLELAAGGAQHFALQVGHCIPQLAAVRLAR